MATVDFSEMTVARPTVEEVQARYAGLNAAWQQATCADQRLAVLHDWDQLRRHLETWEALVQLRFQQDTQDAQARAEREYADGIRPQLTAPAMEFKRQVLASEHRQEVVVKYGQHLLDLWAADIVTFAPEIAADLVAESQLEAEYTELLAAARIEFQGRSVNLSEIVKYREHADRAVRYAAERARWGWFAENRQQLDRIFGDLVRLRHGMARKLGFDNFIGLGYQRMKRVDYSQADVERFRAGVREYVVPLAQELRRRQQTRLPVEELMFWDEPVHDARGNPAPQGDHDWMIARAQEMFQEMGGDLGPFFQLMIDTHLMDLKNRDTKAGGGFCTAFPDYGVPYIFANFNGTKGDVEVFTHEMGHAFQAYQSRHQPVLDYLWPTYESCEIHSMSLEFLTWPHMEKFFGAEAERFRQIHLMQSILFIPYGVAVDHFQHLVYAEPEATPERRHAMWQEVERMYLPWRNYGDLPHVRDGGFWQFQRHIYLSPFYYIDYTLAQTCALQFWRRSTRDFGAALASYTELCARGGAAPFQALCQSAGLVSPFTADGLRDVVADARTTLFP
ncbi:MAG: M3 family oligoendopeptidase [Planctomycetota bacterium]